MRRNGCIGLVTTASVMLAAAAAADSEVIYDSGGPFGSPFGLVGYDVGISQSVAVRFTPSSDVHLTEIRAWFMNNDGSGNLPQVTLTLRNDHLVEGESFPGDEIIETWWFAISAVGWNPQQEVVHSKVNPLLQAGVNYWIMAESDAPPGLNPVWLWAANNVGIMSVCCCPALTCDWSPAGSGAVVSTSVHGTPADDPIIGDLNGDGVVDVFDLLILLGLWGDCPVGAPCIADLNGDGIVDVFDLLILLANWG